MTPRTNEPRMPAAEPKLPIPMTVYYQGRTGTFDVQASDRTDRILALVEAALKEGTIFGISRDLDASLQGYIVDHDSFSIRPSTRLGSDA